ncbi:response regulator transcription factor [Alteribacillus bidgolensis]|uniref:Helix-turn-helix domain-containing protein n=1 Tax=Alteribacillus bidgolensis TaxID=930129 RepID=A0A1G8GX19_9BACI|nr:response regulator [Alteribacillus bidgolensis]SDH98907.1 Helix-turn-helix domain-containing protein [Alteribacillus bidgolensis]
MYKVLLIDDEELILESLKQTFPWEEINCYVAATARNGEEGIEKFHSIRPDLVVTDIKMPDMDGLEFLKEILADRSADEVIVLSGFDEFDFVRSALKYKAFHYLLKPIDREELKDTLKKAINEIEDKTKAQHTTLKSELFEAAFQKNQRGLITRKLEAQTLAVLKIIHGSGIKLEDTKTNEYEIFVYPLSNEDILVIGYGQFIKEQLYTLAESLLKENNARKAALGPEVKGSKNLNYSLERAETFLRQKEYIKDQLLTEAVYRNYQSFEKQSNTMLSKAKYFVEENYHKPLTIEEVAKTFGFSPSYFSTMYKEVNGKTFSEHLKLTRIERACDLLRDTNKPAYEIANMVGYEDQRYFSQVFRKLKQMTPSQYRKQKQS